MAFTFQGQRFESVALARLVMALGWVAGSWEAGTCSWMVEQTRWVGDDEYGYEPVVKIVDCGAPAVFGSDRWACAAGHEHVSMEAREAEGWDYAEDAYAAACIMRGGREARPAGPNIVIDPGEVAQVLSTLR
jgi:hypothetical protein